jgi:hypothetical protein
MRSNYNVLSSLFKALPQHNDAFDSSWHEFNTFVAVEIGLLYSQPFTNSHFHFRKLWNWRPPEYSSSGLNWCYSDRSKIECLINTPITGCGTSPVYAEVDVAPAHQCLPVQEWVRPHGSSRCNIKQWKGDEEGAGGGVSMKYVPWHFPGCTRSEVRLVARQSVGKWTG